MMATEKQAIRVLVVDRHRDVRAGLAVRIGALDDFVVGATTGSVRESIRVASVMPFELAVVGDELLDGSGIELCRELTEAGLVRRCILHAGTVIDLADAEAAGVAAIVLKQLSGSDLVDALVRLTEPSGVAGGIVEQ